MTKKWGYNIVGMFFKMKGEMKMNKTVVFLIDRDRDFINELREKLEKHDFTVFQMCDYEIAMMYFESDIIEPDIIIIGNCDNVEELIKNFHQKHSQAKIIACCYDIPLTKLFAAGAQDCLSHDPEILISSMLSYRH